MSYDKISKLITPDLDESSKVVSDFVSNISPITLVDYGKKCSKNLKPKPRSKPKQKTTPGPIFTATRQIVNFTTIRGIESEIGKQEHEWILFAIKELMENAYDFHKIQYPTEKGFTSEHRKIAFHVRIDPIPEVIASIPPITQFAPAKVLTHIIRITVRNSNVGNLSIPIFENHLGIIFDYDKHASTKRNQFNMTSGALGDFLKRSLGMGYASWTGEFNLDDSFEGRQWNEPTIFRFSGQERKVYIKVDHERSIQSHIGMPIKYDTPGFTEVEIALPIPTYWNGHLTELLTSIEKYCKMARISKIEEDITLSIVGDAE